tara:strand:+ start:7223 stop:8704 length:1482 start_codon:yes stop_codon:yes gene_type:complete
VSDTGSAGLTSQSTLICPLLAFGLVLLPRLALVTVAEPGLGGDAAVYSLVANNILRNFCVSLSDPGVGTCVPHWGGNQLPGYPAFIALARLVADESEYAPLVGQTILFAAAAGYLCHALIHAGTDRLAVWIVVAVLAISPSLIAWPRMLMTETLAAAVSIWVMAEIINSISSGSLRSLPLGLALAAGVFIRYDLILLVIPVAITGFVLHGFIAAFRRGLVVALVVCIPVAGWAVRSMAHGLPSTPPYGVKPDGATLPKGMLSWIATWLDDQYELRTSAWALVHWDYKGFQPPDDAYADAQERQLLEPLLEELRNTRQGQSVPAWVDDEFAAIADLRRRERPFDQYLFLPLRRSVALWANPFASMGWPTEISDSDRPLNLSLAEGGISKVLALTMQYPAAALSKALVTSERLFILFVVLAAAALRTTSMARAINMIVWLSVIYAVLRTLAFSYSHLIEVRYLITSVAWFDISASLVIAGWFGRGRSERSPFQAS